MMGLITDDLRFRIKHCLTDLGCCFLSDEHFDRDFLSGVEFIQLDDRYQEKIMHTGYKVMYGVHQLFTFKASFDYHKELSPAEKRVLENKCHCGQPIYMENPDCVTYGLCKDCQMDV